MCDSWQKDDERLEMQVLRDTGLCYHEICVSMQQCERSKYGSLPQL